MKKALDTVISHEDDIRTKIREILDTDCVYDVNLFYNPEKDELEFSQDTGSLYENDNRVFLAEIRRGISDEDGVALMEMTGLEEWTYLEDFEKFENARDYIEDLIDVYFNILIETIKEKM